MQLEVATLASVELGLGPLASAAKPQEPLVGMLAIAIKVSERVVAQQGSLASPQEPAVSQSPL